MIKYIPKDLLLDLLGFLFRLVRGNCVVKHVGDDFICMRLLSSTCCICVDSSRADLLELYLGLLDFVFFLFVWGLCRRLSLVLLRMETWLPTLGSGWPLNFFFLLWDLDNVLQDWMHSLGRYLQIQWCCREKSIASHSSSSCQEGLSLFLVFVGNAQEILKIIILVKWVPIVGILVHFGPELFDFHLFNPILCLYAILFCQLFLNVDPLLWNQIYNVYCLSNRSSELGHRRLLRLFLIRLLRVLSQLTFLTIDGELIFDRVWNYLPLSELFL